MTSADSRQPNPLVPVQPIEPIAPEEARKILDAAILQRLGDRWDDEETGWALVSGHDYMARLTRGNTNLDFYVDLLGNVTVEEKEITAAQASGRTMAWLFILGSIGIAVLIAWLTGTF